MVTYKDIEGFPGYRISDTGIVQSNKVGGEWRALKPQLTDGGYHEVNLYHNGKCNRRKVHRLVLEAFRGSRPPKHQCRHLNSNKLDNRLDNLVWGTQAENMSDRKESGLPWSPRRLTESKVKEIWRLKLEGKTRKEIALLVGVATWNVATVLDNQHWRWVDCEKFPSPIE